MSRPPAPDQTNLKEMAEQAFQAHAAMLRTEMDNAGLASNPYWQALRETAFARFTLVYQKAMPS